MGVRSKTDADLSRSTLLVQICLYLDVPPVNKSSFRTIRVIEAEGEAKEIAFVRKQVLTLFQLHIIQIAMIHYIKT